VIEIITTNLINAKTEIIEKQIKTIEIEIYDENKVLPKKHKKEVFLIIENGELKDILLDKIDYDDRDSVKRKVIKWCEYQYSSKYTKNNPKVTVNDVATISIPKYTTPHFVKGSYFENNIKTINGTDLIISGIDDKVVSIKEKKIVNKQEIFQDIYMLPIEKK